MIAPMYNAQVVFMTGDTKKILKALQSAGVCEIRHTNDDRLKNIDVASDSEEISRNLSKAKEVVETLKTYYMPRRSMLSAKPEANEKSFFDEANMARFSALCNKTDELKNSISQMLSEKMRVTQEMSSLSLFRGLDADFSIRPGSSKFFIGVIPQSKEAISSDIFNFDDSYVEIVSDAPTYTALFCIVKNSRTKEFSQLLGSAGFARVNFAAGKTYDRINEITKALSDISAREQETKQKLTKLSKAEIDFALMMEDYFSVESQRLNAIAALKKTKKTSVLTGFIKQSDETLLQDALSSATENYYLELTKATKEDDPPVAFKNNKFTAPFEGVMELYSLPKFGTLDPSALLMPVYSLFFGIMVSDLGYGILLMIISTVLLKLKKPKGLFKKIMNIVFIGGIFTVIAGFAFGTVFGFEIRPLLANMQKDPMFSILLCLGLGILSIVFGLGIGMYVEISRGNIAAALWDKLPWMVLLISAPLLAVKVAAPIAKWTALAAVLGVFLGAGRGKKNVFKRVGSGLAALYNIMGYLSDVLSYSRLFGMGLATGVIGMVFNTLAGIVAHGPFGYVFMVIIFAVGHAFNIGINTMGAYVHASRLMYIEIFPKFYEDGGKPFVPLSYSTKHYEIKN